MSAFLDVTIGEMGKLKRQGERALAQVPDTALHTCLDPESNSLAILVRHLAGNMRSRWTDFLTTDGEKPDRHRDAEFEAVTIRTRAEILGDWESGWACVFAALEALTPADLDRTVRIRGEALGVLDAIQRQLSHYACHVGQMVFLAKHLVGPGWKSLSVPRGQSPLGPW